VEGEREHPPTEGPESNLHIIYESRLKSQVSKLGVEPELRPQRGERSLRYHPSVFRRDIPWEGTAGVSEVSEGGRKKTLA